MNLAIFGGSFDPIHEAHIKIISTVCDLDYVDKLIILPNFLNPLKDSTHFSPTFRLQNIKNAIKPHPKIIISDYEIAQNKPSYSIDSILFFKQQFKPKKIFFIIGADILAQIPQWKNYEKILNEVELIIATRGQIPIPKQYQKIEININISSTQIRQNLLESQALNMEDSLQNRVERIIQLLDSKKASDIKSYDLQQCDYITQFVIIATSLADKHSYALLDYLKEELKKSGEIFFATDEESGDWIIADLGDIMVHIFTQNHRNKFNLDEFLAKNIKKEMGEKDNAIRIVRRLSS